MFWMAFFVGLAFTVVGELIRPKPSVPNAKASGIDDFDMPTADANRIVPVFAGKVLVNGANVSWYGGLKTKALTRKVKTGLTSSKRQTYAHQYRIGIQHILGFGGGEGVTLHNVYFDEMMARHTRSVAPDGSVALLFNDMGLYGGNEEGGGIQGVLRFYPGNDTQAASAYMAGVLGEPMLAYRGVCHAVFEDFYIGTSTFPKAVSFEVSRYPNALGVPDGKHVIGEDCNPAAFIFEVLTNQRWGVGKPANTVDLAAFRHVAEQLHTEGLGVSVIYNGSSSASDLIADILRHVDGVLFSDPTTGLATIKLIRDDYVTADLPVIDATVVVGAPTFSRPSWSETKGAVSVTYVNRAARYVATPFILQDPANIAQRGGEIATEDADFSGFTTVGAAAWAGNRILRTLAYPLANFSVQVTRKLHLVELGDAVVVNWPELGLNRVVFRVTGVRKGSITENTLTLNLVEDAFSVSTQAYAPPKGSDWVNPAQPPVPAVRQGLVEAPYFLTQSNDAFLMALASRGGPLDLGADVRWGSSAANLTGGSQSSDFSASGVLLGALSASGTSATVSGLVDGVDILSAPTAGEVAAGDSLLLVRSSAGEEIMAYTAMDTGTGVASGLKRGLFDTVPQSHPAGAQVWFLGTGFMPVNDQGITAFPSTWYAKVLPYSALGSVPEADATLMQVVADRRSLRPLPPGKLRIGGAVPGPAVTSPFVLSWAHRSRLDATLVEQSADSRTVEAGVTYTIRVKNGASVLVEQAGISNTASAATIRSSFTGDLTVEIFAVRGGLASWQVQSFTVPHTGAGSGHQVTADEAEYVMDGGTP